MQKNKKIIIVEDDYITQELYKNIIKKYFIDVDFEIFSDGEEALKRICKNHFDILLTDVKLKFNDIDGFTLARSAYLLGKPVFIITGGTTFFEKLSFFIKNIDMTARIEYLTKPIDLDKFKIKLKKLLNHDSIPLNDIFRQFVKE